jgi:hypothetical protein
VSSRGMLSAETLKKMSDETSIMIVVTEVVGPAPQRNIDNHWCDHAGCKRWGSFGFAGRYGTSWYCGEHRSDAER